ncbi:hypothetical protein C789_3235 [Microcystis aeruginosa FACHB-905 = DIANCHI905]|nr:hypothetical protein C789_3235 [Microcystis aeruginosa FACHB-905 = DIANCHI905]
MIDLCVLCASVVPSTLLCLISLTECSDRSLCPLYLCGSFHSLASRTVS